MTANNSPHQGTATSDDVRGCLPDSSLSVVTFLKINTDFSLEFETGGGRWLLSRVRSVSSATGYGRHGCLKIRSVFARDYI